MKTSYLATCCSLFLLYLGLAYTSNLLILVSDFEKLSLKTNCLSGVKFPCD